jgi:hypothetical protein
VRAVKSAVVAVLAVATLACYASAAPGVEPRRPAKPAPSNSAAAQYGKKVAVCAVTAAGRQHTILLLSKGVPAYLGAHPAAHIGLCIRPRRAKLNVCVKLTRTKVVALYVPVRLLKAYLKRNAGSYRTSTGKCTRR